MESITVSITEDGGVRFLNSPLASTFEDGTGITRRASNVEPVAYALRIAFYGLRRMFGEYGRMASFTRMWPCLWRVNLAPIGGDILPGTWRDRSDAIAHEIAVLNETFI